MISFSSQKYVPVTRRNVAKRLEWEHLAPELQEAVQVVSRVLPFRTNGYVMEELIDWDRVPEDPIYQLTFPQRNMLDPRDYDEILRLIETDASREEVETAALRIRWRLNPHPAGQLSHNVPMLSGRRLKGIQHKYRETVLCFPAQAQTCHAYCTYCFRWAQFANLPEMKFQSRETEDLVRYLGAHPEVTDLLVTGGDPMIMRTAGLRRYLGPVLDSELDSVRHIRFGTKSLAYWPQRFVTDADADDLLRWFEEIVADGRHVAVMAHLSHPRELSTEMVRTAIRRIRRTGAQIRMQAPLVRHVNDDPEAWAKLWNRGVSLGMIPYYMFVERDTGPRNYFEVPLAEAHRIFRQAYARVSGLGRTVRGPSMSAFPGKTRVLGSAQVAGEKVFVLDFLQARNPRWVRQIFFARYDPEACWLDDLEPAFGEERFFFEEESSRNDPRVFEALPVAKRRTLSRSPRV